mmetsp:Transcript_6049/g.10878  ORF Transcript_6049/g.10878 Transcript_6049/m.10878 type:complete len:270 (+) Transcript_6049:92-901(+)
MILWSARQSIIILFSIFIFHLSLVLHFLIGIHTPHDLLQPLQSLNGHSIVRIHANCYVITFQRLRVLFGQGVNFRQLGLYYIGMFLIPCDSMTHCRRRRRGGFRSVVPPPVHCLPEQLDTSIKVPLRSVQIHQRKQRPGRARIQRQRPLQRAFGTFLPLPVLLRRRRLRQRQPHQRDRPRVPRSAGNGLLRRADGLLELFRGEVTFHQSLVRGYVALEIVSAEEGDDRVIRSMGRKEDRSAEVVRVRVLLVDGDGLVHEGDALVVIVAR